MGYYELIYFDFIIGWAGDTPTDTPEVLMRRNACFRDDFRAFLLVWQLSSTSAFGIEVAPNTFPGEHVMPQLALIFTARHGSWTMSSNK